MKPRRSRIASQKRPKIQAVSAALVVGVIWVVLATAMRAQTLQYDYDSMQRLTRVTYSDGTTVEYVYDNLGNRLMQTTTLPTAPSNTPPNAVSNPGIGDGAVNVIATPVLTWPATSDADGSDSVVYYVYFGTTSNPPLVTSGWLTNWSPGALSCYTTYYWYVVARDNHNSQTSSPVWSFTTGDVPPIPDFSAQPASGLAPLTVSFQDQSQYPCGAIASWQWSFSNNGTVDATNQNPSFTYTASGDYTVKLRLQDEHGGVASVVKTNFISVLGPSIIELVPTDLQIESAGPYGNLIVSYLVTNTGTISLSGKWQWSDWVYLSSNQVVDASANFIASFDESQVLPAGAFYRRTNMVLVSGYNLTSLYVVLNADGANQLEEINTNNNVLAVRADTRLPDLVPGGLSWSGQAIAGQPLTVSYSVTNRGTLDIKGLDGADVDFYDGFYLSTNATFDANATPIGSGFYSGTLPAGAAYTQSGSADLPFWPAGNYWLFVNANNGGQVAESDLSNNTLGIPISVGAPNLVPVSINAPQGVASDARIQIVYTVTNQGNAAAIGFWADTLYLSTNSFWDTNAYSLVDSYVSGPVPPQSSYESTNSVRLPGWSAGSYYLLLKVDSYGFLSQGLNNNAALAVPITLQAPAGLPDLVPISLVAPAAILPGSSIQVVYSVTNSGPTPEVGSWFDELFLSTNAVWDTTASAVGAQFVTGPVPNGSSYTETNTAYIPNLAAGNYYLILQVDAGDATDESTRTNKYLAETIVVQPASALPQFAVLSLLAPGSAKPGQSIQVAYAVTNQGGGAATGPWFDVLGLSTNGTIGTVADLGFWLVAGPVAAGSGYTSTNTVVLPSTVGDGNYYLVLNVDYAQSVNQSSRAYNVLAVPIVLGTALVPTPIALGKAGLLANGAVQFSFTNTPGASFKVFATTNVSLPLSSWTLLGSVTEISPGQFQYTDLQTAGSLTRFYRVRSP
jgi:YD repeat-containing protein